MKPDAPDGIRSQFGPIDTAVPGIQISDQLPQIAKHPVTPEETIATLYHAFGLPPESLIYDQGNRPHHISDGQPLLGLFG